MVPSILSCDGLNCRVNGIIFLFSESEGESASAYDISDTVEIALSIKDSGKFMSMKNSRSSDKSSNIIRRYLFGLWYAIFIFLRVTRSIVKVLVVVCFPDKNICFNFKIIVFRNLNKRDNSVSHGIRELDIWMKLV